MEKAAKDKLIYEKENDKTAEIVKKQCEEDFAESSSFTELFHETTTTEYDFSYAVFINISDNFQLSAIRYSEQQCISYHMSRFENTVT